MKDGIVLEVTILIGFLYSLNENLNQIETQSFFREQMIGWN